MNEGKGRFLQAPRKAFFGALYCVLGGGRLWYVVCPRACPLMGSAVCQLVLVNPRP